MTFLQDKIFQGVVLVKSQLTSLLSKKYVCHQ